MKIRVLTYNIHKCIGGVDRKYRPDRVADVIRDQDPDIALLQEVDSNVPRSNRDQQVDWLGDELAYPHRIYQVNVRVKNGGYGNAILSRWPLDGGRDIDLTMRFKKRRRCLLARAVLNKRKSITLASVHLGLAGFERKWQIRRLLRDATFADTQRPDAHPTIIGGDFNDVWRTLGRMMKKSSFRDTGPLRTFPATMPAAALDRFFYRGSLTCVRSFSPAQRPVRSASDHRPIVADFDLD